MAASSSNVYLYWPNLIGYARICLLLVAIWHSREHYQVTAVCYLLSSFLDCLDGHAARHFHQESYFGAILDTVIDRTAIVALKMTLVQLYPSYSFLLQLDVILDLAGHWMYTWMSQLVGARSHKSANLTTNPVLRLYYSSRPFLFYMVAGSELFWALAYVCHFAPGPALPGWLPLGFGRLGLWQALALACLPVAAGKAVITLMHVKNAARRIVEKDLLDRAAATDEAAVHKRQ